MSELKFLKGNDVNLPSLDNREEGTFYVTTDSKKIVLGDAVWQDTETVKEEIKNVIIDNELTIAAALTRLHENKVDSSALTESLDAKQDLLESGVNIKTINGTSILGSGNIALDFSFYEVVSELPVSGINTNKIYVVPSANGGENNIHTEYMFVNDKWEIVGTYAASVDLTGYATEEWVGEQLSLMEDKIPSLEGYATESWVLDNNFALANDLEDLSGHVLDNEVVIAAALTDLHNRKLDISALTENLNGYATEEWVSEQIENVDVTEELSNYYTKQEIDDKGYLSAVPETYVTEDELSTAIENKAEKSAVTEVATNLETLSGHVLDNEVTIAAALTDLEETKADKSEIPSLGGYATEEWVENLDYVSAEELANQGYATETFVNQGLSGKQETLVSGTNIKTINGESLLIDSTSTETNIILDVNIFKVVSSLPTEASEIETNKIYLVLSPESAEGNVYIEYMYINNTWEEIGKYTATINLDPYALKTEVEAVDGRVTELSGNVLSNEVTIAAALTDLNQRKLDSSALTENLGAYAFIDEIPTFASQIKVLDENNVFDGVTIEEALNQLYQMIMNLQN